MAQLHEYQAKRILAANGIATPRGDIATTANQAGEIARRLGNVVIKAQIHSTSRAAGGGIRFADSAHEATAFAGNMLGIAIAGNQVESVLIDEMLEIEHEFYLGFIIDDLKKRPILLFSPTGGSGIEERAESMNSLLCSIRYEPTTIDLAKFVGRSIGSGTSSDVVAPLASALLDLYRAAISCDARTAEINPFVRLADGRFVAADARISVDDYAVYRHPELGIELARELGHTPTKLERIAWEIEKNDFRGTFYFVEIFQDAGSVVAGEHDRCRIGFHGAGGGGSMASLDAAHRNGLDPACYVDTSGNPPASKVYRAAKIILSIPGIRGYFLSGSGVASQEQFGLARAVLKAFLEVRPNIPAVLRLGGNGEDVAKAMVERYATHLPAPIEAYRKNDSADFCAARLRELIGAFEPVMQSDREAIVDADSWYRFATRTGTIFFDHVNIDPATASAIVDACPQKILMLDNAMKPVLAIQPDEAERGKCSECLACEFAALDRGSTTVKIVFPTHGLN